MTSIGETTWHSSEEDGGPDVGISIDLGDCELWCGEITDSTWKEAWPESKALGKPYGHWIILYDKGPNGIRQVIGKCTDPDHGRTMIEQLAAAFRQERRDWDYWHSDETAKDKGKKL